MNIKLTSIKVNEQVVELNLELFDTLCKTIEQPTDNYPKIIVFEDSYYSHFYDEEISLFWFFFKTYLGLKNLENSQSNNFDCLQIVFKENLTKLNKPHVLKFVHDNNIDFFTNFKKINPDAAKLMINAIHSENIEQKKFLEYFNSCGSGNSWKFSEKNIEKMLSTDTSKEYDDSQDNEKLFFAKKASAYKNNGYNNFYYTFRSAQNLNDDGALFKRSFLKFLNNRQIILNEDSLLKKLILFVEIETKEELNILTNFINDSELNDTIVNFVDTFVIVYKKDLRTYIPLKNITKINSSLVFYNCEMPHKQLLIKNSSASFLIGLLKIKYKNITKDDFIQKQKITQLCRLIFNFVFIGSVRVKTMQNIFKDLFYCEGDNVLLNIDTKLKELSHNGLGESIGNLEEDILGYITNLNIKKIFISKSNFCLNNDDLNKFKDMLTTLLKELKSENEIKVEVLKKYYPVEMNKNCLLICVGEDAVSRYFEKKVNLLKINLDYVMDEVDVEIIKALDFKEKNQDTFLIKSYHHCENVSSNKKVLYYLENDDNIYIDNIKDMYERDITKAFVLIDHGQIKEYCQKFMNNYTLKSEARKKIKLKASIKTYSKNYNRLRQTRREYYLSLAEQLIINLNSEQKLQYSKIIRNNLKSWIENSTLPRERILFLIFLELIGLNSEAKKLLSELRYETSLNQRNGKEVSKEIESIFEKEWDSNEDFNELVAELKSSKLFKECTININSGE